MENGNFTKRVAVSLASLGAVALVGYNIASIVNSKADATDLKEMEVRVRSIESSVVTKEDLRRVENKVDILLLKQGVNPSTLPQ